MRRRRRSMMTMMMTMMMTSPTVGALRRRHRNMPRLTPRPRDLQAARAAAAREQREATERHNQYIRDLCAAVCAPAAECENARRAAATARAVAATRPAPNPPIVIGEYIAPAERGPSDAPYVPPPSYCELRARFM